MVYAPLKFEKNEDLQSRFQAANEASPRQNCVVDENGNSWTRMPYGGGWMITGRPEEELPRYGNGWTFGR